MKLIQTGCIYIHGRDKYYRPALVIDIGMVVKQMSIQPELITSDNCIAAIAYIWRYMKEVMFLDGHIEQWVSLFDFS